MLIRLQKYLADMGVASRRKCEEYIKDGLVKVNGKTVTEMGTKVDAEKDKVEIAEHLKMREQNFVYYAFNKPVGYVCTISGAEEPKITELIKDIPERVFPVGRLDKLTAGLLILTNDGRFTYEMTHPKFEKEKEYIVKTREKITPEALKILTAPIFIYGEKTKPADIQLKSPHLMHIILHEGKNRQIRRLCDEASLHIEKLKRIRIEDLMLGDLNPGEYRELTKVELEGLMK
jgi:pseudouridine synthase